MQKIVKFFEKLVNQYPYRPNKILFKHKNISKSKFWISNVNKFIISFISLLFFYLFYLSIPNLYDKSWVQNTIEDKLIKEFEINFSISSEISYNILPSPHFLIKNSKIIKDNFEKPISLAEIKTLRIFISQNNFFNKEKMSLTKVLINDANFSFQRNDIKLLDKIETKRFSNKKIKVINSNFFFKDRMKETVAIIKISEGSLFYDDIKLLNNIKLNAEIFNLPFKFNLQKKIFSSENKVTRIESKKIKLNMFNESYRKSNNLIIGKNITTVGHSKISAVYKLNKNIITFNSQDSKIKDSNLDYMGTISIKPFDLNLDMSLKKYKLSKLFNTNSFFVEFLKTELFFNENISANISLNMESLKREDIFDSGKINFNIKNGNIDFNKTKLINDKIGSLQIIDSYLFIDNGALILNSNVEINIENLNNLFSFLQTTKKKRKSIKKINLNLDYDFSTYQLTINNFKIDNNESDKEIVKEINDFYSNKENNLNKSKRMYNKLLSLYEG